MGVRGPVFEPDDAGRAAAAPRPARGLQGAALAGAHRCPMALFARRFAPWQAVYQQTRRWLAAGVFETMTHDLRALLRWTEGRADEPTAVILDSATRQSTPESGHRAGYDGYKRRKGSKIHLAVDTLGHLLAVRVTPANAQDREQVAALAATVQDVTGETVELAFVDQGYPGEAPTAAAQE